ncbi:MAG: hypothetical protein QG602_3390 [Verrucomicrobiota bacterium]|nr:hypothetical protein [Verrucomicrobiota bacterium]
MELLDRNGSYSSARTAILYSAFWDEVRDDPRFGRTLEVLDLARQYPQARAALASQKIP